MEKRIPKDVDGVDDVSPYGQHHQHRLQQKIKRPARPDSFESANETMQGFVVSELQGASRELGFGGLGVGWYVLRKWVRMDKMVVERAGSGKRWERFFTVCSPL